MLSVEQKRKTQSESKASSKSHAKSKRTAEPISDASPAFGLAGLDPRTKLVMIAAISTAAMAVKNLAFLLGLLLFTVLSLALGGVKLGRLLAQAKAAFGMVAFLFLLQALFGQAELGALLCIRLLVVILSALILMTGAPRDYLLGLVQWKVPYEIAYMVLIGLHFFPILREEAMDVSYSIQLRGTELQKASLKKKLRTYLKISLPVLAGAMERAKDTSISMEARAFRAYPRRTYMRKLRLKTRDICLMVIFPIAAATFIFAGCASPQESVDTADAPSQIILSQTAEPAASQAISWHGSIEYEGCVQYGTTDAMDETCSAQMVAVRPDEYYRYQAVLRDLKPGTRYFYRVGDGTNWSRTGEFTTAGGEESTEETTCLYMGDIQYQVRDKDYGEWGQLLGQAWEHKPQLGIFSGDMVEKSGDTEDWSAFFSQAQPVFSSIPMATVPGNHETSVIPYTYLQMMPVPQESPLPGECYSFDRGNCHFLMLNSCFFMEERVRDMGKKAWKKKLKQLNGWIQEDLRTSTAKWNVAVLHHPPYPAAEDDAIYRQLRKQWVPLLEHGKTNLVLCGHQHLYMRTKPIHGITYLMGNAGQKPSYYGKASGGKPSYAKVLQEATGIYVILKIGETSLKGETFNEEGQAIDTWEIAQ